MTTLVLIRHGLTDWNAAGRFQGQADIPLNEVGHAQALTAARALASMRPHAIYASPLIRTRQTAAPLAEATGLPVITDDRLKEIHVGTWEGLTFEDVASIDPDFGPSLRAGQDVRRSPQGETASETGARCKLALDDIATANPDQLVVVVSHGVALRQGIAAFLGWEWRQSQQLGSFDNCSWARLEDSHGHWRLASYNVNAATMLTLLEDRSAEQREG